MTPNREASFREKYTVDPDSGCWLWHGAKNQKGYGSFWSGSRSVRAHRWAYERVNGPIAEDLVLDHRCRVRHCVNPDHLESVTLLENIRRGVPRNQHVRKTHCSRGHPYSGENLYVCAKGWRQCRACNRLRKRKSWTTKEGSDQ